MKHSKSGAAPARAGAATTTTIHHREVADPGRIHCSASGLVRCSHSAAADETGDDDYVPDYRLDREWAAQIAREQAKDDERRDIIRRLFDRAVCATGTPEPFTQEWFAASATVQLAAVALLGPQYLPEPPTKQASRAIAGALDWRAEADAPSFAELQRRRAAPVTPLRCVHPGCRAVVSVPHPLPEQLASVRCGQHQPVGVPA